MLKLSYQLKAVHKVTKQKFARSLGHLEPRCCASQRAVSRISAVFVLATAMAVGADTVVFAQEELSATYSRIFAGIFGDRYQGPGISRVLYTQGDPVNFLWGLSALGETLPLAARVHAFVDSQPAYGQVVTSAFAEFGYAFKVVETEPPPWYASFGVPLQLQWSTFAKLDDTAYSPVRTVHASAEVLFNHDRVGISFRDSPGVDSDAGFHYAWRQAGQIYSVAYRASCTVANDTTGGGASCEANADPIVTLNQAALDAHALSSGRQIYRLADYYRIEYSPDLLIVPEPRAVILLAIAGGITVISRVRRPPRRPI